MIMTLEQAHKVRRPDIEVGKHYPFYSEMQEEYRPPEERMNRFTGQTVLVVGEDHTPTSGTDWTEDDSILYRVQASDGSVFTATLEELNGWDRDLGQYFWPDMTYGPDRDTRFIPKDSEKESVK